MNNDYIEKYLKEYFNVDDINEIFKTNIIDNTIDEINNPIDLFLKYKILFETCFENVPNKCNDFLFIDLLENNYTNIDLKNQEYKHPRIIFQVNLWEYLNPFIKNEIKENFIVSDEFKFVYNLILNEEDNDVIEKYKMSFKNIFDLLNCDLININLKYYNFNGSFYLLIPYDVIYHTNYNVNINIYSIDKEFITTNSNKNGFLNSRTYIKQKLPNDIKFIKLSLYEEFLYNEMKVGEEYLCHPTIVIRIEKGFVIKVKENGVTYKSSTDIIPNQTMIILEKSDDSKMYFKFDVEEKLKNLIHDDFKKFDSKIIVTRIPFYFNKRLKIETTNYKLAPVKFNEKLNENNFSNNSIIYYDDLVYLYFKNNDNNIFTSYNIYDIKKDMKITVF